MAVDHLARQTERDADPAHLVLEELAQRLDELQLHALGQAADVVVRLDDVRLAGLRARGLDDVGVDRALPQPLHVFDESGLLLEDLDEQASDDLALRLRLVDALERVEIALRRVDADHAHAHVARHRLHHLVAFAEAQETRVDEHARELVADRALEQRGDDRRIHTARQPEQHVIGADLRADPRDRILDDVRRGP
jgi:hypothetical protein